MTQQERLTLYTIGYGNRTLREMMDLLEAHDILFLIDVRSQPYSRHKPEFNVDPLIDALKAEGFRYVAMGDTLGGRPDDPSVLRDGVVDYELLSSAEFYLSGIARLEKAYAQGQRVAIMCSEGKPENCHRAKLIGKTLTERNIPVLHIDENGTLQTQATIERRMTGAPDNQLDLFNSDPVPEEPDWFDDMPDAPPDWLDADVAQSMQPPQQPKLDLAPDANALGVLQQVFGYDQFRPLQAEIINNVIAQQDTLVIMPTGGGKSLCFQIPALLSDGLTVVVSPLIALMEDQVTQLTSWGIPASYLNSSLDTMSYYFVMDQVRQGDVKLLYLAPETLLKPDVLQLLAESELRLLAIDEAHCISSWGHDFRPEYRQLVQVRERFPQATCVALTATATPRVQADIRDQLAFSDANTFVGSFDRPNFYIDIQPKSSVLQQALAFVDAHKEQSGIIYCGTRKDVDALAQRLQERGLKALPYHAGLSAEIRSKNQSSFIRDETQIMVATVAFGMGIDKPDVRYVLHVYLPKNIEAYYQQIGRAGRDGLPADVRMLFSMGDVVRQQRFIEQGAPSEARQRQNLLQALVDYAASKKCRRTILLDYFGQDYGKENCDGCDNCTQEQAAEVDITTEAQKFLATVARTGGYFGASHIIDVLRGSRSKKIMDKRHHELSVYNIGADISKKEWTHFARQFVDQGLLNRDMKFGSLTLTAQGRDVMKGNGTVMGDRLPQEQRSAGTGTAWVAGEYDQTLFGILRARRASLASAAGVPPYVIFGDRSLIEMATHFPQSRETFGRIHGVGSRKIESFADEFIPLIVEHCQQNGLTEKPKVGGSVSRGGSRTAPTKTPTLSDSLHKPRWQEVGEAVAAGASFIDLTAHYNVKVGTIVSNVAKYVEAGGEISAETLQLQSTLSQADQQAVLDTFDQLGDHALRPVFEAFNSRIPYDELHLFRMIYRIGT